MTHDFADSKAVESGTGVLVGLVVAPPTQGSRVATVDISGLETKARVVAGLDVIPGDVVLVSRFGSSRWVISIIAAGNSPPTGSVVSVGGGDATVRIDGRDYETEIVPNLSVSVNDVVLVQRRGNKRWTTAVVVSSGPAPGDPAEEQPKKSVGDSSPNPKSTVRTGILTCKPIQTSTYRNGKWRNDGNPVNAFDTFQGRFRSSSFGRQTGCAFYGKRPRNVSGATVTKVTVRLKRLRAGNFAGRRPRFRLVNQNSRPSGAPTLEGSAIKGPSLKVGQSTTFTLPDSWGQALVDGDSGGIAMQINSDSPYIALAGRNSLSTAWTLNIYWKRG